MRKLGNYGKVEGMKCGRWIKLGKCGILGTSGTKSTFEKEKGMGRKPRHWVGIKVGHVTIVRDLGESSADGDHCRLFEGICDCGRSRIVKSKQLSKGIVKTCGSRKCAYRKPGGAFGHGFPLIPGVAWALTAEESFALRSQPCWYCGSHSKPGHQMGLVRLRDEQPYTVDNCIPCCVTCGNMRGKKMKHEEFLAWLYRIVSTQLGMTS